MRTSEYFESLSDELTSLKNRIRTLVRPETVLNPGVQTPVHWQTDGEWKESALRSALRRQFPANAILGRGFVIDDDYNSHQIDILVYDARHPVLLRDGELVFVRPQAVLGLIEVKSSTTAAQLAATAAKLGSDVEMVRRTGTAALAGIFSYESTTANHTDLVSAVANAARTDNQRIDVAAIGPDIFVKYWNEPPDGPQFRYHKWHSYHTPRRAAGYFLHNFLAELGPPDARVPFPIEGKEIHLKATAAAAWSQRVEQG